MRATIFCVAGRLGGDNAWPTEPRRTQRRPLAGVGSLAELAAAGFEIGSHGMQHLPLHAASARQLSQEIVDSKHVLEQSVGAQVSSFAYPYGLLPREEARPLVRSTYSWACTTRPARVRAETDPYELPRVDIHYLRLPTLLSRAAHGSLEAYIDRRRRAARVRRRIHKDYTTGPAT